MDLELQGKHAIVTGGSRGIGKAVARELAREGAEVVIAARTGAPLEATAAELASETGGRVLPIACDTSDELSVQAMVSQAAALLGGVDILVNSAAQPAGQSVPPRAEDVTADAFWADMNVKVLGYLRCAQAVIPYMRTQHWGRIINISGLGARQTGNAIGSMRNVSVAALTKNLADELGRDGINVTVVHPGVTRTEAIAARAVAEGVPPSEIEYRMAAANVLGQLIDAREIAYIVAFLASPRSVAITGDAIAAGGGAPRAIYY